MKQNRWILIILFATVTCNGQKFTPLGIDSSMHHTRGNIHYATILEHFSIEQNIHGSDIRTASVTQINAQADCYLFHRIALSGTLFLSIPRGEHVIESVEYSANTIGAGLSGGIRIELLNLSYHNFYVEGYEGMIFTKDAFPPKGTPWNFIARFGFGYTVNLAEKRYLIFGWRWMHISNGTGFVPSNPSYDGNGLYIGFKFTQ